MITYIALLRGINVGGHKKIKMAELRENLAKHGFQNVQTYIQSGNIILSSDKSKESVNQIIKASIQEDFGFEVPVLTLTLEAIKAVLKNSPFQKIADTKNLYFTLLHTAVQKENLQKLNTNDYPNEDFVSTENCIYLNCKLGAAKAKLNNNVIENKLKVTATTRNLRTLQMLMAIAGNY
jgi:uncharacterized protein (DUF1697 family)